MNNPAQPLPLQAFIHKIAPFAQRKIKDLCNLA